MEKDPADSLAALEKRIAQKEQRNLQAFQKELLTDLRAVRDSLVAEAANTTATAGQNNPLVDKKDQRIAELEAENKRLNYRILHLTRNLQAAMQPQGL